MRDLNEDLLYLVVLDDQTFVRKMRWDQMWHLVNGNPAMPFLKAGYKRISSRRARALIRRKEKSGF